MATKKKGGDVIATHLVVSCIDHRCTDDLVSVMADLIKATQPWNRYDHLALPGASLGVVQTQYPAWGTAFWQQVEAALQLHPFIKTVLLVDHLHCGAYGLLYSSIDGKTYDGASRAAHDLITRKAKAEFKKRHPRLEVQRWVLEPCDRAMLNWKVTNLDAPKTSYECVEHAPERRRVTPSLRRR